MDTENKKPLTGAAKAAAERKAAKEAEAVNPANPDAPATPETPAVPDVPNTPETPEASAQSETPDASAASETPDGSTSEETPPAGDPQGSDPSPEFRGKGADEISGTPPVTETQVNAEDEDDPFVKLAKQYAKMYPKNKVFYITSDMQVFLETDKRLAAMHQKTLPGQAFATVKI